jgi:hypothetical protein
VQGLRLDPLDRLIAIAASVTDRSGLLEGDARSTQARRQESAKKLSDQKAS